MVNWTHNPFLFIFTVFLFPHYFREAGRKNFFSNLLLAIPFLLAAISGIGAFLIGILSIIRNKERSFFVFVSTGIDFIVMVWCTAEILFPH